MRCVKRARGGWHSTFESKQLGGLLEKQTFVFRVLTDPMGIEKAALTVHQRCSQISLPVIVS